MCARTLPAALVMLLCLSSCDALYTGQCDDHPDNRTLSELWIVSLQGDPALRRVDVTEWVEGPRLGAAPNYRRLVLSRTGEVLGGGGTQWINPVSMARRPTGLPSCYLAYSCFDPSRVLGTDHLLIVADSGIVQADGVGARVVVSDSGRAYLGSPRSTYGGAVAHLWHPGVSEQNASVGLRLAMPREPARVLVSRGVDGFDVTEDGRHIVATTADSTLLIDLVTGARRALVRGAWVRFAAEGAQLTLVRYPKLFAASIGGAGGDERVLADWAPYDVDAVGQRLAVVTGSESSPKLEIRAFADGTLLQHRIPLHTPAQVGMHFGGVRDVRFSADGKSVLLAVEMRYSGRIDSC
jgi:hypothetical protein